MSLSIKIFKNVEIEGDLLIPHGNLSLFFKVVLQRANLRTGEEEDNEGDGQMFQLQLAQLVGVAVLLCAM